MARVGELDLQRLGRDTLYGIELRLKLVALRLERAQALVHGLELRLFLIRQIDRPSSLRKRGARGLEPGRSTASAVR